MFEMISLSLIFLIKRFDSFVTTSIDRLNDKTYIVDKVTPNYNITQTYEC